MYIEVGWVFIAGLPPAQGPFTGLEVSRFPHGSVVDEEAEELHTLGQNDPPDDIGSTPLGGEKAVKNGNVLM